MMPTSNVLVPNRSAEFRKSAVGSVRVSTSMQAEDGLSLDAQRAAITAYCNAHELRLLRIYTDVESGAKSDRRGLENALAVRADVFVVLKFDRLVNILLVFAQMEREAIGERTREAIGHIRRSGYHYGSVPYGKKSVPASENPRYRGIM